MDWQQIISLLIVVISLVLITHSEWRKHQLRKNSTCGGECNCAAKKIAFLKIEKAKNPHT